jgi:hypothetical protein
MADVLTREPAAHDVERPELGRRGVPVDSGDVAEVRHVRVMVREHLGGCRVVLDVHGHAPAGDALDGRVEAAVTGETRRDQHMTLPYHT